MQSIFNTLHYNTDFDIIWSCLGCQILLGVGLGSNLHWKNFGPTPCFILAIKVFELSSNFITMVFYKGIIEI